MRWGVPDCSNGEYSQLGWFDRLSEVGIKASSVSRIEDDEYDSAPDTGNFSPWEIGHIADGQFGYFILCISFFEYSETLIVQK